MAIASNGGGGYEYQFVDTPSDTLVCKICQYVSREPYLSLCCGHTFCKSCLEGAKRATTIIDACPICRDEDFVTVFNKQANRIVRNLSVFCTNKKKGCEWQGEVNKIANHLKNSDACQFENMTCPNDCGMCLQRQYLSSHIEDECMCRKVDCQYCHITGEHQFVVSGHKEQCPKFPVPCPNKCGADNTPREYIGEHRKVCPLEEVTCPNDCGTTLQRQYLTTHIKVECPHLEIDCQYCHITGEQQFIEGEHKEQCPKFPITCPNKCEAGSVPRDDVVEHLKKCPLELIQCEYHVVGCEERMARKDHKKHNKEKMEEHLSLTAHQLANTQHDLASNQLEVVNSRGELTAKITRTGKDLASTKQQLTSTQIDTVKTIDRLIQRLQQTEKDLKAKEELTTSQLEKCRVDFTVKVEEVKKATKEQLALSRGDFSLKLQQTEDDLRTKAKKTKQQLEEMMKLLTAEVTAIKNNLSITKQDQAELAKRLTATQLEAKTLTQKIENTERELNTTKQQLATACQSLIKAEKEHTILAANTNVLEAKFQSKITEIETAAQKRITELETKLEQTNELLESLHSKWTIQLVGDAATLSSAVPVIVKMSEYTKKKSDEFSWYSDSFYTHYKGYKMCLCVEAGGISYAKGTHLSVGLVLLKGPYDDQLRWPLKGRCEVKLLNQISNNEHHLGNGQYYYGGSHNQVIIGSHDMWCSYHFINNQELHKITTTCQYLKDDSIFFQVEYKLN